MGRRRRNKQLKEGRLRKKGERGKKEEEERGRMRRKGKGEYIR